MIGAIVHQLTRNLKDSQIQDSAVAPYFVDHTAGVYPTAASGAPWSAFSMQVKGDPMADLSEDLAAEEPIKYWCPLRSVEFCDSKSRCAATVFRIFNFFQKITKNDKSIGLLSHVRLLRFARH